ncbi:MAG: hypothetical protein CSA96_10295 [Bacteroidetes bacterium]|nr:MAG: hypothetical protein CSA96_10295 [Bacteroidota bacterium]
MKNKPTALLFLLLLQSLYLSAQPAVQLRAQAPAPFLPKLYLHIDREIYFPGDSIWFSAYYLNGQNLAPLTGLGKLYTDLIAPDGTVISHKVWALRNGKGKGKIELPSDLNNGHYMLRSTCGALFHLGEEFCTYRPLEISTLTFNREKTTVREKNTQIALDLLPEGGHLLAGIENLIAIKALTEDGLGVKVRGRIVDGNGKEVATFHSSYKGLGHFHFVPEAGETYRIEVDGFPGLHVAMPAIETQKLKLFMVSEGPEDLLLRVQTVAPLQNQKLHFAILHRGNILFHQSFQLKSPSVDLRIEKAALSAGIHRFLILDEFFRPLSERLYFNKDLDINEIEINTDRTTYSCRKPVELSLTDPEGKQSGFSRLSLSVVNKNAMTEAGPGENILTALLLGTELKGYLEGPADFFNDEAGLTSSEKLDLLMLTQGWRSYRWADPDVINDTIQNRDNGICLTGQLQNPLTKWSVPNISINAKIFNNIHYIELNGISDEEGRFMFSHLDICDTASVLINTFTRKRRKNVLISLDPLFPETISVSRAYHPGKSFDAAKHIALRQQQYFNEKELTDYLLATGSLYIDEVQIVKKAPSDDGPYGTLNGSILSLKVTEKDHKYPSLLTYLQGRVSGLQVYGDMIVIRDKSGLNYTTPLFLLDETRILDHNAVIYIPMSDIDKVEVSMDPRDFAISGADATGGIIAVYTKKGASLGPSDYIPGLASKIIAGYSTCGEFYSPRYTPNNLDNPQPDHRLTLYWDPDLLTEKGKAEASFFSSDDAGNYLIQVEGITGTGKICLGTAAFKVYNLPKEQ